MANLLQDIRYSLRGVKHNPLFAFIIIIILALGIGANTAIFSFVNGVLLKPLPFDEPEQLMVIGENNPEKGSSISVASPRNLEDWEKQSQTIEQFGAWRDWRFGISTAEGKRLIASGIASPGLFLALKVKPVLGRVFLTEENQKGRDHVILISHSFWKSQFGGDTNIVGQSMILDKESFTIVGVLPPEMESLDLGSFKIWAPLTVDPDQFLDRSLRNRRVYGRLKDGVSINEAQAEMSLIAQQLTQQYPKDNAGWEVSLTPLMENVVGEYRSTLFIFLGAVGLVLLIACANIANLMLAKAATRRKEFAIRSALGAGQWQMIRQLLTESVLLSAMGGLMGFFLAFWLVDLFIAISPDNIPRVAQVKVDGAVLAFTSALSILTGMILGLVPALQSSKLNLVEELKEGQSRYAKWSGFRFRSFLVISQIAIALVLLIGAALLGQTFFRLMNIQTGFNPENLHTVSLFLPMDKYKTRQQISDTYQKIAEELKSIPGVQSVGATSAGPQFGGFEPVDFLVEGQAAPASGIYPQARYFNIGADYFHTLEVPVMMGREFNAQDNASSVPVAIINETMAKQFFKNQNPIGKRVQLVRENGAVEVVGVVGDMRRYGLGAKVEPEIYYPFMQKPRGATFFAVRTDATSPNIESAARARLANLDPEIIVTNVRTFDYFVTSTLRRPQFNMLLLIVFAGLAVLLATVGIYAVMSYTVTQSTREIGIRIALGAQQSDILKMVMRRGLVLTLTGIALGIFGSFALTRVMSSALFNISPTDPATFVLVSVILISVAMLACFLPARRATKVDPMMALRNE
ncbi:MAG: ABC transporter permease [Acidobacteriota bacterium]